MLITKALPFLSFLFLASACSAPLDEQNLPCHILFANGRTESGCVLINGMDYRYNPADSSVTFDVVVERSNMQDRSSVDASIVPLPTEPPSVTADFPAGSLEYPSTLTLEEGVLKMALSFKLDLRQMCADDSRDMTYAANLQLQTSGNIQADSEKGRLRLLLNAPDLLKEIGIYNKWILDFSDDFDGTGPAEGYNKEWWGQTTSAGHANIGYRRPETISRQDGILVCGTYRSSAYGNAILSSHMYHRKNYLHARFEFRVRIELDPSECVGGVILTWPHNGGSWPRDGEMDMYETFGSSPNALTFIHYGTPNGSGGFSDTQVSMRHPIIRNEWHTMAVDWTEDELRIYRDYKHVWTIIDKKVIPSVPHYFCIQSGPNNEKLPVGERVNMYVDWVKIYVPGE